MNSMQLKTFAVGAVLIFGLVSGGSQWVAHAAQPKPNRLSTSEQKAGWILLFDGKTTSGWRGFTTNIPPANWKVQDECLHNTATGKGGNDLVSEGQFDQFELQWEWKLGPGANSGLKYFVRDNRKSPLGHEYQMIDDANFHGQRLGGTKQGTGAFYDVLVPKEAKPKPLGQFNQSRILVFGRVVQYWLNGAKILEYELSSEALKKAIADSKFASVEGFDAPCKGRILLQNHGDEVWFRNIKIRPLSAQ